MAMAKKDKKFFKYALTGLYAGALIVNPAITLAATGILIGSVVGGVVIVRLLQ